jgi:hypothetical protein
VPSLDALTPDQRAVLDLVLRRGRSYDDIARLLSIDRAAVRARALAAFDAIGPETGISSESRALITDYLLGQLPARVAEQTRERLAESPYERAWARMVASELEPVAAEPLPEIPGGSRARGAGPAEAPTAADGEPAPAAREARPRERAPRRAPRLSDRPSSRLGGALMLGGGALVVIAVVVVLVLVLGGGSKAKHTPTVASNPTTTSSAGASTSATSTTGASTTATSATGTSKTGTSTAKAQAVAQINLNPPSGSSSSAKGVGIVVKDGSAYGMIIEAQKVAPNSHNAYAAWLYNSPTDSLRLGFVNPAVGKSGALQVGTALPANAGHYKELLLTLETSSAPKTPGTVILEGPLTGVPNSG